MPVPKRKRSRARRDKRFANKGLTVKMSTSCSQCDTPLVPHAACKKCGFYKGMKVMTTKLDRAVKRGKLREVQAARRQQRVQAEEGSNAANSAE